MKLCFQKYCGICPLLAQKKRTCWRALDALGQKHPSGCSDAWCCHIPEVKGCCWWRCGDCTHTTWGQDFFAGNVYPNSHSVFLTSPQRSSPRPCTSTASLWQGVAKLLESSPKFMCCMSLMALQNTYSTGCFLPTLAYRRSSELIKRKLYFLFLFILCLYSLLLTLVDFIVLGQN